MRRSWKALPPLAFIGFGPLAHLGLRDSLGVAAAAGVIPAGAYSFLLWFFGRTLRAGSEPLITRVARSLRGPLPPQKASFTRGMTVAWCVFFAAQLLGSALLLALAPFDVWSVFINVLDVPLVVVMFVVMHAYRGLRFPNEPPVSMAQILSAFAEVASSERSKALQLHYHGSDRHGRLSSPAAGSRRRLGIRLARRARHLRRAVLSRRAAARRDPARARARAESLRGPIPLRGRPRRGVGTRPGQPAAAERDAR